MDYELYRNGHYTDDGGWLPALLDPTPLELAAACELCDALAKSCRNYVQRLEGKPVSIIFDCPLDFKSWFELIDALDRLGSFDVGDEPIRYVQNIFCDVMGWSDCEAFELPAVMLRETFQSLSIDLQLLYPRLIIDGIEIESFDSEIFHPQQIRWLKDGDPNTARVWYEADDVDRLAVQMSREVSAGNRFPSHESVRILTAQMIEDAKNGILSDRRSSIEPIELTPENVNFALAIREFRRYSSESGRWVYHDRDREAVEVNVTADMRFPKLSEVLTSTGEPVLSVSSEPQGVLDVVRDLIREAAADRFASRHYRTPTGDRQLIIDLTRCPKYDGYAKPDVQLPPYRAAVYDTNVFDRALEIEADHRLMLCDQGDPAWLVNFFLEFEEKRQAGALSGTFRDHCAHRFSDRVHLADGLRDLQMHYANAAASQAAALFTEPDTATFALESDSAAPASELPKSVRGAAAFIPGPENSIYETFTEHAAATWLKGTDNYRLAESLRNGECDYTEALNALLPAQSRSAQTKRFHAVTRVMNKKLAEDGKQIEIRRKDKNTIVVEAIPVTPRGKKRSPKSKS